RLYEGIIEKLDHVILNGHPVKRIPNTLNLSFEFIEGESLLLNLDLEGIAVSSGSACTSGSLKPSHVLQAMAVPSATAQGSIRFSLGRDNTEEDVEYVIGVLPEIVNRLRAMSPLYPSKENESG
ncbi:MAG: aminotransferase class V-fold PLP-dependent enzyme, partial [Pseudomonadota bacterium]